MHTLRRNDFTDVIMKKIKSELIGKAVEEAVETVMADAIKAFDANAKIKEQREVVKDPIMLANLENLWTRQKDKNAKKRDDLLKKAIASVFGDEGSHKYDTLLDNAKSKAMEEADKIDRDQSSKEKSRRANYIPERKKARAEASKAEREAFIESLKDYVYEAAYQAVENDCFIDYERAYNEQEEKDFHNFSGLSKEKINQMAMKAVKKAFTAKKYNDICNTIFLINIALLVGVGFHDFQMKKIDWISSKVGIYGGLTLVGSCCGWGLS